MKVDEVVLSRECTGGMVCVTVANGTDRLGTDRTRPGTEVLTGGWCMC
jgi:hypothetical protein